MIPAAVMISITQLNAEWSKRLIIGFLSITEKDLSDGLSYRRHLRSYRQVIKLFTETPEDYFTNRGLLRMDIRSDHEIASEIIKILGLIIEPAYTLFHCDKIATKAIPSATERITALNYLGFELYKENLLGMMEQSTIRILY